MVRTLWTRVAALSLRTQLIVAACGPIGGCWPGPSRAPDTVALPVGNDDGAAPHAPDPAPPAHADRSAGVPGPDPAAMYAGCRERVEGASTAGECVADSDCAKAGCGGEVCVSVAVARAGLMTTCEQRPCFQALDRCTCQAGTCAWTVKTSLPPLPPNARPGLLPPRTAP